MLLAGKKVFAAAVVSIGVMIGGAGTTVVLPQDAPAAATRLSGAESRPASDQLGSADFYPTPEHPVGYRGDGTGLWPGAINACTKWSEHAALPGPDVNILWRTELEGFTQSHPIVVGGKVITLEEPNRVVCLDANSGKLLWRRECDHLSLFPAQEQERAKGLLQKVNDTYFFAHELFWEYNWLTGTYWGKSKWQPDVRGARQRRGNVDDTQATADRIAEIEKLWTGKGFGGAVDKPLSPGHGIIPFAQGTPAYDDLAAALTDLQVDFGICPFLMGQKSQTLQHGQTQNAPTSDGKHVYAVFGYGHMACLDLDGNIKWMKWHPHLLDRKELLRYSKARTGSYMKRGFTGPSPLLIDDKIIVVQGFVIRALRKDAGELLWEVKYGNGIDARDGRTAFRGPGLLTLADGTKALIFPQGYVIRPSDGKVLCDDKPLDMFKVPFGNMQCYVQGLVTRGDVCYFTWARGAGALRVTKAGPDTVKCEQLWLTSVKQEDTGSPKKISEVTHGDLGQESIGGNAPVYDPDRKRVYLKLRMYSMGTMYSFNAETGEIIDSMDVGKEYRSKTVGFRDAGQLPDAFIVGGKHIYMQNDYGGCYVIDADNFHTLVSANCVFTDIQRDIALWKKPWSEIKPRTICRQIFTGEEFKNMSCTPGNIFIQGGRTFIRTIEGLTCVSAQADKK